MASSMKSTKINSSHIVIFVCGILLGAIPVAITAQNELKFQRLRQKMYKYHLLKLVNEIDQIQSPNEADLAALREIAGQVKMKLDSKSVDSNEVKP
jgi:hypothetical protein